MKKVITFMGAFAVLAGAALFFQGSRPKTDIRDTTFWIGSEQVRVSVPAEEGYLINGASQSARTRMEVVYQKLSVGEPGNEIADINKVGASTRLPLSKDVYNLLDLAVNYSRKTQGAYDLTMTPLKQLWGLFENDLPDQPIDFSMLSATRNTLGYDKVEVSPRAIRFTSPYVRIDVEQIRQGYAVDLAILKLRREGYQHTLIQQEAVYRCLGTTRPGFNWSAEVPNPFDPASRLGHIKLLPGQAVAFCDAQGDFVDYEGRRYVKMIDPRTGQLINGMAGVIVLAPTATEAQMLAHALMAQKPLKGVRMLEAFPRCDVAFIPDLQPLSIWATEGFEQQFVPESNVQQALTLLN